MPLLIGDFFMFILEFMLFCASGFMILLVLVQRGRGGGLTGALGGMGGQSAFGAKAGDVFTRITVGGAIIWICLCLLTIHFYSYVPVNTTAMKEYQYTKLFADPSTITNLNSAQNIGSNADDGPGASLKSADTDQDIEQAKQEDKNAGTESASKQVDSKEASTTDAPSNTEAPTSEKNEDAGKKEDAPDKDPTSGDEKSSESPKAPAAKEESSDKPDGATPEESNK